MSDCLLSVLLTCGFQAIKQSDSTLECGHIAKKFKLEMPVSVMEIKVFSYHSFEATFVVIPSDGSSILSDSVS
jgi:hypothetical protein